MAVGTRSRLTAASCFLTVLIFGLESRADDCVSLDHAAIVAGVGQASFVQYGVEDLAGFLKDVTGHEVPVVSAVDSSQPVQIVVGSKAAREVLPSLFGNVTFGEQDYVLKCLAKNGVHYILAAGIYDRGTKLAVCALMKAIRIEGKSPFVPASLDVVGKPAFAKRGLHPNGWANRYPYAFRNWREEDWQRYLDILSYQGVNLFMLWPFIEIMPVPLSTEDQKYLEECRRVVDYAQKKHGMEVWIMQTTNIVAKDRCGVADPRYRPYWQPTHEYLNPGKPEHLAAILASREAMYKFIDNADGVCNIDSDPGAYPGSTLDDYLKLFQGCRALLDRYNVHGKQAKLIDWMEWGWSIPKNVDATQHQRATVKALKQGLAEPWGLICDDHGSWNGSPRMSMCRQEGVFEKVVNLRYGVIEGEPAYPATNVWFDQVRAVFDDLVKNFPELSGVMGNVQLPLIQFPNVYFYTSFMWDLDYRKRTEKEALSDLAGYLYPEHRQLLADCYLALKDSDPAKVDPLLDQLDRLVREDKLGALGIFGRKLFPDHRIVAQSLVLQLRLRTAMEKLAAGVAATTPGADCEKLLGDYLSAFAAWDIAHGWHMVWGWRYPPEGPQLDPRISYSRLKARLGDRHNIEASFNRIAQTLAAKYNGNVGLTGCVASWKAAVLAAPPIPK